MNMNDAKKIIRQNSHLLNLLRFYKEIDKSELSRRLQISMPTVYNALEELTKINFVKKDEQKNTSINSEFGTLVGISIGTSLCKISFLDLKFELFSDERFLAHKNNLICKIEESISDKVLLNKCANDMSKNYIYFKTPKVFAELKVILNDIFEYLRENIENNSLNILSIGISCTGLVNNKTQTILDAYNLSYLNNLTLDALIFPGMQNFFDERDIYVCLVQNSNASVIAEKISLYQENSSHKKKENIISLYLGVGTGSGIYLGKLYGGTSGFAGEAGHTRAPICENEEDLKHHKDLIDKGIIDAECTCGCNDCYDYKIRSYVFEMTATKFCDMSSDEIRKYLEENPIKAKLFGKYLGNMINTLTSLFNVDLIIFTGKFYKSMDLLLNYIDAVRDESPLRYSRNDCKICTSIYGSLAPSIGAAIYSYHKKYNLEMSWEY